MLARYAHAHVFGLSCLVLAAISGCTGQGRTTGPVLLFPSPPETPRVQFLTWASGAEQIEAPKSGLAEFALGGEPINRLGLEKPYGLAVRDGVVYVCDTKIPGICRLDFKNRRFSVFGTHGPGRLRKPINVAMDPLGYKFVADAQRKQVVVFGPHDEYVTAFDVPPPCKPVDVAVWDKQLYVLDNDETCQVVVMDRQTGEVLRTFGERGEEPGQFKKPNSLCFGPEGHLYVSDTFNWRIQKLTREGELIWSRGQAGRRLGEFGRPRGLRVGPDGVIYVADAATELIQMLNDEGEVLMHFGGPGTVPGSLVLPATAAVDTTSMPYFKEYIHKDFKADYLLFVSSQYGQHLVSVYAFGSFPEGYRLSQSQIASLPAAIAQDGTRTPQPSQGAGGQPDSASEPPQPEP